MKHSIIIPTYNRADLLGVCLNSIRHCTDFSDTEVIIVSNGCKDNTQEVVGQFGPHFKLISWPEPIGYARAVNIGINASSGQYIVVLNNDTEVYAPYWLDLLREPFEKFDNVGITGPLVYQYNAVPCVMFFCAMIRRTVIHNVGYIDEQFVNDRDDTDFCIRTYRKGYTIHQVPTNKPSPQGDHNLTTGHFPIRHLGGATRGKLPNINELITYNNNLLSQRYGYP